VRDLESNLLNLVDEEEEHKHKDRKEIRVWMDGAFDMMHYGHMNAFRQGKALGMSIYYYLSITIYLLLSMYTSL
jgi:ethanolamine-phosphate cytidylyltransferase